MTVDVLVVGSLHRDVVVDAPRLPRLDETLPGSAFRLVFGGKGGNQAVAAARMGARTAMVGRVGRDAFGEDLLAGLDTTGVDRSRVTVDLDTGSGMSVAIVDDNGDYGAVIVSGANLNIPPAEAADAVASIRPRIVVLQNEVPVNVNRAAASTAAQNDIPVIWNAAPARDRDDALLANASLLVVNRGEAVAILGAPVSTIDDAAAAVRRLAGGRHAAVITLGAAGAMAAAGDGTVIHVPAVPVAVVSTHGAGDMFVGALAARLAAGASMTAAVAFASAAAALHVSSDAAGRAGLDAGTASRLAETSLSLTVP
ncbi:MAG: PfkB family carbohydrate kinase [Bauldia sp.]|nr:PfkB family carbohydrate kinase [Bauldia sp.]